MAFRTKGLLYTCTPVPSPGADPDLVVHVLVPSDAAGTADRETHLEVIRQGQWLGFRSVVAGDRLLQTRRRGQHRLVFFSQNLGTWEQWELVHPAAVDASPWQETVVVLRHRRLPHVQLQVEVLRVGVSVMNPLAAITPRSLPVAPGGVYEDENIKRVSGVLAHVSPVSRMLFQLLLVTWGRMYLP